MDFAPSVTGTTDSVLFWGRDRTLTVAAALAFARRADPSFFWLDVTDSKSESDPCAQLFGPLVPDSRKHLVGYVSELAPNDLPLTRSMAALIQEGDTDGTLAGIVEFLRLPYLVQRMVSRATPRDGPAVLLVTNADRAAHFYRGREEATETYMQMVKSLGVKPVLTYVGPDWGKQFAIDRIFRVHDSPTEDWRSAIITTDRYSVPDGTVGSRPTRLGEIASVRDLMAAAGCF
jgi:hypothetical protein